MRRNHKKDDGKTIGTAFSRALIMVTVTVVNFWKKNKKKGKEK